MEGTMAEIRMFAGPFAPKTWAYCQGQTLAINTNQALFSLLGTTYGGNGVTTFMLPNFSGRTPVGIGTGPGLTPCTLGENGGSNNVTLTTQQMPAHTHGFVENLKIPALADTGDTAVPSNNKLAGIKIYSTVQADSALRPFSATLSVMPVGGTQPISIQQPFLAMNIIICLMGVFPSRN